MTDILGRELKDGDLCIGMAIGRNSSGMHIGIFKGQSVVHLTWNEKNLSKSSTSNTYLIEHPTEQELAIKAKVEKLLEEEENERKRKANLKTIPLKDLEVGGIYKSTQGCTFVYLGKRKVIFEDLWRKTKREEEGHCFAGIYYVEGETTDSEILDAVLYVDVYRSRHHIDVLKGNKKLTEMVKKIDLEFPMVKTQESNWRYSNERCRLTIE